MSTIPFDTYDILLELLGYKCENIIVPEEDLCEHFDAACALANELRISLDEVACDLVIWNDEVNDMMHVTLALYEVCKLNNEDSMRVMMDAHNKGRSVARSGSFEDLSEMASSLRERNINVSFQFHSSDT